MIFTLTPPLNWVPEGQWWSNNKFNAIGWVDCVAKFPSLTSGLGASGKAHAYTGLECVGPLMWDQAVGCGCGNTAMWAVTKNSPWCPFTWNHTSIHWHSLWSLWMRSSFTAVPGFAEIIRVYQSYISEISRYDDPSLLGDLGPCSRFGSSRAPTDRNGGRKWSRRCC